MPKSNQTIINEAREYLDGLMLGDGHILYSNGSISATAYQQSCKYKNWLDIISKDLYEYGIINTVDNGKLRTGGKNAKDGSMTYRLWTNNYIEFKEMHDRWYKKDYNVDEYPTTRWHLDERSGEYYAWKKIVPKDICLSPACVANWYLGDGTVSQKKDYSKLFKKLYNNGYQLIISTDDFIRKDTIFLADLLSEVLGISCGVQKNGRIGIYSKTGISIFLNYIRNYKIDCYSKKFPDNLLGELYLPHESVRR